MTNRKLDTTHRAHRLTVLTTAMLAVFGAGLLTAGCGEEEQQAAPQQVQQPRQIERRATLDGVQMDARVQFPADNLPRSQELVEAIASFASALASGDASSMRGMLDGPSEAILSSLVESGDWERETDGVEAVRVVTLQESEDGARLGLAVQDARGAYLLGWQARNVGGRWLFAGLPVADASGVRASDLDGSSLEATSLSRRPTGAPDLDLAEPDERRPSRPTSSPGRDRPSRPSPEEPMERPAPL